MEIEKKVNLDTLTEEEKEALDSGEKTEEDFIAEYEEKEQETLKQKEEEYQKAQELAQNYKIRAEKAEAEAKKIKKDDDSTPKNELSQSDLLTLIKSNVEEDDIQEIVDYAAIKKISVREALDSNVIKSLLAEKKEERKSAEVSATQQKRSGTTMTSGSELLNKAETTGELPDNDDEMRKLVESRLSKKAASK